MFSYKFPNAGLMVLPYATAPLNETPFVVEWVVGPDADAVDETDQFCRSDSELSSLIAKCSGLARLRAPTADETSQIEALQTEAEGKLSFASVRAANRLKVFFRLPL